jgi:hypothetical protein
VVRAFTVVTFTSLHFRHNINIYPLEHDLFTSHQSNIKNRSLIPINWIPLEPP